MHPEDWCADKINFKGKVKAVTMLMCLNNELFPTEAKIVTKRCKIVIGYTEQHTQRNYDLNKSIDDWKTSKQLLPLLHKVSFKAKMLPGMICM